MKTYEQFITESASLNSLNKHLKSINGKSLPSGHAQSQAHNDPDLHKIMKHGKTFTQLHTNTQKCKTTNHGECHWNAAAEYKAGNADRIAIGYAHHPQTGWHQHTWGVKGGKVVEPSPHDRDNTHWHGRVLSKKESDAFAAHVSKKQNYPGAGNVRTHKGGSVDDMVKAHSKSN